MVFVFDLYLSSFLTTFICAAYCKDHLFFWFKNILILQIYIKQFVKFIKQPNHIPLSTSFKKRKCVIKIGQENNTIFVYQGTTYDIVRYCFMKSKPDMEHDFTRFNFMRYGFDMHVIMSFYDSSLSLVNDFASNYGLP